MKTDLNIVKNGLVNGRSYSVRKQVDTLSVFEGAESNTTYSTAFDDEYENKSKMVQIWGIGDTIERSENEFLKNAKPMKDGEMKIRNINTGEIVVIWPSTEHTQSSYGIPVWVDETNYCYGQCDLWPVPFGFELITE